MFTVTSLLSSDQGFQTYPFREKKNKFVYIYSSWVYVKYTRTGSVLRSRNHKSRSFWGSHKTFLNRAEDGNKKKKNG